MNHRNRIICLFIALATIIILNLNTATVQAYTNYNGIHMTDSEYDTLVNLGFTRDEIYYMDIDTFNANKDAEATLLASETKYYKTVYNAYGIGYTVEVTEEEYNNSDDNMLRDTQNTPYKTIVSTLTQNGSRYRYKVSVLWKQIPSVKKYDIIGVGYQDDVHIYNSIVYFTYHYTTSTSAYNSTQYYDRKITSLGASAVYKIPNVSLTGLSATIYYDVEKDTGVGTLTSLSHCGDYAHATSNSVTSTLAAHHTISYGGIGLFADNSSLYDAIPCTYASVTGISW